MRIIVALLMSMVSAWAAPSVGASAFSYSEHGVSSGTNLATASTTTAASGSTFIVWVGRFDTNDFSWPPGDNKGNTFVRLGSFATYAPGFPSSGCAVYVVTNGVGGAGHVFNLQQFDSEENSIAFVEVLNGGVIADWAYNFATPSPVTSSTIAASASAILVGVWAGDTTFPTNLVVGSGFTMQVSKASPPPTSNYIQGGLATKVGSAGSYNVTWTSSEGEGANMWLFAVQSTTPDNRTRLQLKKRLVR